jgi:hypothetical protein
VTFDDMGGKTVLTMRAGNETLDRLGEHLETL